MKNLLISCILLVFSTSITCKSSAFELPRHKDILKAKTSVCSAFRNIKVDSTTNYSININGLQNLVILTTDSLKLQTTKSMPNKAAVNNTIKINGQGNTVAISQENKNSKVDISQNGNNNTVKISQSSHQP